MKVLKWCLGVLLLVLGIVALVLYKLSGAKALGRVAIDAIEATHAPAIAAQQQKLADLEKTIDADAIEVEKSRADVERRKNELRSVFTTVGLSTDEVIARLERLKL